MVEDVPAKYNEQTELVVDIFDGANTIDFNLITANEEDEFWRVRTSSEPVNRRTEVRAVKTISKVGFCICSEKRQERDRPLERRMKTGTTDCRTAVMPWGQWLGRAPCGSQRISMEMANATLMPGMRRRLSFNESLRFTMTTTNRRRHALVEVCEHWLRGGGCVCGVRLALIRADGTHAAR